MDEFDALLKKYGQQRQAAEPTPPRGRILVIDDDPNIRQGLERTLVLRNYEVITAVRGEDGVRLLDDGVHAVVLDVKLPAKDGTEVFKVLRKKRPGVPILFYSAYPGNDDMRRKCMALNPYAYIEKGVSEEIDRLYDAIRQAVIKGRETT